MIHLLLVTSYFVNIFHHYSDLCLCVFHMFFSSNFCFNNVFDIEIDMLIISYIHVYVICMVTHIPVYIELEFPFNNGNLDNLEAYIQEYVYYAF